MSKMIPLKIADMAVESCNKEIARLLFEKAELQGRVIALEAQLESEKAAYKALRASSFVTSVPVEEYEKLKAEVERLTIQRAKLIESAEELFRFVGEELYGPIDHFEAAWEAAKEGKQS